MSRHGRANSKEALFALSLVACVIVILRPFGERKFEEYTDRQAKLSQLLQDSNRELVIQSSTTPWLMDRAIEPHLREVIRVDETLKAIARISRDIEHDPQKTQHLVSRGLLHESLGDLTAAQKDFAQVIRLAPNISHGIRGDLARVLARQGRFKEALSQLDQTPYRDLAIQETRAYVLIGLRQEREALKLYEKLYEADDAPSIRWGRAAALRRLGEKEKAEKEFAKVQNEHPRFCLHWPVSDDPGFHGECRE